ncbi:MAG: hypothetical protein KGN39_04690, partial [Betaproteobacteria bacterium]|nr:hypothetical protein [Betaproteobacteria bacterium]
GRQKTRAGRDQSVGRPWLWIGFLVAGLLSACAGTPGREQPLGMVVSSAFSPDSKLLGVSTSEGEIALFDTQPLWFRRQLSRDADKRPAPKGYSEMLAAVYRPQPLVFSPDGTRLAAVGVAENIVMWDIASGAEQFRVPANGTILDLAFFADGQKLLTAGPEVLIRSTSDGKQLGQLPLAAGTTATAAAVSSEGLLLIGLSTGEIALYDGTSLQLLRTWKAHQAPVTGLAFGPDGKSFASTAGGYDLRLWKKDGEGTFDQGTPPVTPADAAESMAKAQGAGAFLWLLGTIRGFQMVGAPTLGAPPMVAGVDSQFAKAARNLPHHCGSRVAFSANGRYLASTANLMLCPDCIGTLSPAFMLFVTDLATGKTITARDTGCAVAISPDGRIVATGTAGKPLLWDSTTGQALKDVPPPAAPAQR